MDTAALIVAYRTRTDDLVEPYLWSDTEVVQYLNAAENEAADRALLIEDKTTPDVVEITIEAGVSSYDLHPSILRIDRAKLDGETTPLRRTTFEALDKSAGWEADTGTPLRFVDDEQTLVVHPKPTAAGTLRLWVRRLPIAPLTTADKKRSPEIHARHHDRMLDWALRCGYLKHDSDAYNEQLADKLEASFTRSFGVRRDANVQRKQREGRTTVVKYGGL